MRRKWLPPVAVTIGAFVAFAAVMGYPWQLALLAATAIGAFTYSAQVTWERQRRLHRQAAGRLRTPGSRGRGRAPRPPADGSSRSGHSRS